jgi:hypothetical protein
MFIIGAAPEKSSQIVPPIAGPAPDRLALLTNICDGGSCDRSWEVADLSGGMGTLRAEDGENDINKVDDKVARR